MNKIDWKNKFQNTRLWRLFNRPLVQNVLVGVLYVLALVFLLGGNISFNQALTLDEVANRTIQAPVQARVEDEDATERLRQEAENNVMKSYQEDSNALSDAMEEINHFYRQLDLILQIPVPEIKEPEEEEAEPKNEAEEDGEQLDPEEIANLTDDQRRQEVEKILLQYHQLITGDVQEETKKMAAYLLNAPDDELTQMANLTAYLVNITMSKPVTEEFLENTRTTFMQQIVNTGYPEEAEKVVSIVGAHALRPNMIYDEEATERARVAARDEVEPVTKTIKAGEIIVREGDRVTREQISILEQLGLQDRQNHLPEYIGLLMLVVMTGNIVLMLVKRYYTHIYKNRKLLYLVALIMVIVLFFSRLIIAIQPSSFPEFHQMAGFMAPVAACSFLVAIMVDVRLAYVVNMLMTLYLGIMSEEYALQAMGVAFVGGGISVYFVTRFSRTSDLTKSGLYVALVNMLTVFAFAMMDNTIGIKNGLIGMGLGFINGLLCSILTIGLLPYLENAFSITSTIRLLELADPSNPLLKRLLMEAPGTYHHSLMVGNLAEATAPLIQADAVLVRVGAYYHDIGKMKRPEYFVENQQAIANPHERIAPALSAMIITGHVRTGIEMARQYNLPPQITDFIACHHGTSLAGYFYAQAVREDGKENVKENNYRYEGPKPRSKEVALVMLADASEAAVRSLSEPTRDKIRTMVHNIIKGKLADGQLDECDLTFHDLDIIGDRFCEMLENIYHKRIAYPDARRKGSART